MCSDLSAQNSYVYAKLTTNGIKGYFEYYLHIVIKLQELAVWLNVVQIGIEHLQTNTNMNFLTNGRRGDTGII